jgi:hypothetical protein
MRAARALLALALALLACRPAAADRELCVRTSPCSAAGGQGALLTRHQPACILCVPASSVSHGKPRTGGEQGQRVCLRAPMTAH